MIGVLWMAYLVKSLPKGLSRNNRPTLLQAPRLAGKARAASNAASEPAGRSPEGRGGGRASASLPLLDDDTASPASRRLASARPALAPKWTCYYVTDPKPVVAGWQDGLVNHGTFKNPTSQMRMGAFYAKQESGINGKQSKG
jgi:hypothetical protein